MKPISRNHATSKQRHSFAAKYSTITYIMYTYRQTDFCSSSSSSSSNTVVDAQKINDCTYRVCQKGGTLINDDNIMSYKRQNTRYFHCLNNFNICYYWFIELCAQYVHPAAVQPKRVFRSVRWFNILLESPSVLMTLGSDIKQQSFTNNTFTVIRAVYFCSRFNENNASFDRIHETPTETITICI